MSAAEPNSSEVDSDDTIPLAQLRRLKKKAKIGANKNGPKASDEIGSATCCGDQDAESLGNGSGIQTRDSAPKRREAGKRSNPDPPCLVTGCSGPRTFYTRDSLQPMLDVSEDDEEGCLDWVKQAHRRRFEDLDLNEGEKEMMILWDDHLTDNPIVADCHVKLSLNDFVDKFAGKIRERVLFVEFVMHVENLRDYGLLSQEEVSEVVQRLRIAALKDSDCHAALPSGSGCSSAPLESGTCQPVQDVEEPQAGRFSPDLSGEEFGEDFRLHLTDSDEDERQRFQMSGPDESAGALEPSAGTASPEKSGKEESHLQVESTEDTSEPEFGEDFHLHLTDSE